MRVMTWNIWSGKNWKEIARTIQAKNAEVIGLQEVDDNNPRTNNVNVSKAISEKLGYHYVYLPSHEIDGKKFGNAIISKFPILKAKRHFLSTQKEWMRTPNESAQTEPRTLLEATIDVNGNKVSFMTTHLAYSKEFQTTPIRLKQVKKLLQIVKRKNNTPIILTGDFNSPPKNEEITLIKKILNDTNEDASLKTWTTHDFEIPGWKVAKGLNYKIDYVFLSKNLKHDKPFTINSNASDHLPIITDVKI